MDSRAALTSLCLALAVTACSGGEEATVSEEATVAIDTAIITNAPREPLTEADLAGMDLANLSVEMPWNTNKVSRDPGPAAPRAFVESADVSGHEGFDRVVFTFSSSTPFPGYEVQMMDVGAELSCGEDAVELSGDFQGVLRVRVMPAYASVDGRSGPRAGIHALGQERFDQGGVVCDAGQDVIWIAGYAAGEEIRVMQFRNPNRLVVDIR